MSGNEILIMLAAIVLLAIAGAVAVPRVLRSWSAATTPVDERLEYAAQVGKAIDRGPTPEDADARELAGHREIEGAPIRQL